MNRLFEYANSIWVKYSDYVITENSDGIKHLQPAPNALPKPYDPVEVFENIALDAVKVGQLCMSQEAAEDEKHEAIRGFALKYGLLGIMTAIPTTPRFLPYEKVFFPKNHFIREESLTVEKYLDEFFPFKKPNIRKNGSEYSWDIEGGKEVVLLDIAVGWQA